MYLPLVVGFDQAFRYLVVFLIGVKDNNLFFVFDRGKQETALIIGSCRLVNCVLPGGRVLIRLGIVFYFCV